MKKDELHELYFPTEKRARYEYILQKAKKVLADQELVVRVSGIRPGPGTANPENFPSTLVELELIGIPFEHPITKQPIIPRERLEEFFQSTEMQSGFVTLVCRWVGSTVPDDLNLRPLKRKLTNVTQGHPSDLPPTLDLKLLYHDVTEQVKLARRKLNELQGRRSVAHKPLAIEFTAAAPADWRWVSLIKSGKLTLTDIAKDIASSASQLILAEMFGVTVDAIHSRLWPRKRDV